MTTLQVIFLMVAFGTLFSAGMVVSLRKMMHAALFLVLTLMGVAFMFSTLGSSFFAIVQVLVYIGSIQNSSRKQEKPFMITKKQINFSARQLKPREN